MAFADASGVAVVLPTVHHHTQEDFSEAVKKEIRNRGITDLVVGLPLLLSGEEGAQVRLVRGAVADLEQLVRVHFLDERYSSVGLDKGRADALAAQQILSTFLDRLPSKND